MLDADQNLQDSSGKPAQIKSLFPDLIDGSPEYGDSTLRLMQGVFGDRSRPRRLQELQILDLEIRLGM